MLRREGTARALAAGAGLLAVIALGLTVTPGGEEPLDGPGALPPAPVAPLERAAQERSPVSPLVATGTPRPTQALGGAPVMAVRRGAATGPVRGDTRVLRSGSAQERGLAALRSLPYPWQELGVRVAFRPYSGGLLGLYDPGTRRVTVYVKRTQSTQGLRVTIAHELGHALDHRWSTAASRRAYLLARGLSPRTPWLPCDACSDYASGAGDFAEVFALSVAGGGDFRSRLGGQPGPAELARLAPFFRPPSVRPALPPLSSGSSGPKGSSGPDRTATVPAAPRRPVPVAGTPTRRPVPRAPAAPSPSPTTSRSPNLIDGLLGL